MNYNNYAKNILGVKRWNELVKKYNVRFDKAGDVNLKRKKIQVKFQNATLAQVSTILKLAGIKN